MSSPRQPEIINDGSYQLRIYQPFDKDSFQVLVYLNGTLIFQNKVSIEEYHKLYQCKFEIESYYDNNYEGDVCYIKYFD